jgi:hypothetical protein
MFNSYDLGDLVRVSGSFTDENGDVADPSAVFCAVRDPAGTVTTYEYGEDAELVKDDTGEYHLDIDANVAGYWYYRWYATGSGQAAEEDKFYVVGSRTT